MKELLQVVAHGSRLDTLNTTASPTEGGFRISVERVRAGWVGILLHALRAGRVVAVVDVKSLALQDEGSDAVLPGGLSVSLSANGGGRRAYLADGDLLQRPDGHVGSSADTETDGQDHDRRLVPIQC